MRGRVELDDGAVGEHVELEFVKLSLAPREAILICLFSTCVV